jgi:hypothetical protein
MDSFERRMYLLQLEAEANAEWARDFRKRFGLRNPLSVIAEVRQSYEDLQSELKIQELEAEITWGKAFKELSKWKDER